MRDSDIKKVIYKRSPVILVCSILFLVISGLLIYVGFVNLDHDKHPIMFNDIIDNTKETKRYAYVEIISVSSFATQGDNNTYFFLVDKDRHFYIANLSQDTYRDIYEEAMEEGENFSFIVKGCSFPITKDVKMSAIEGFNKLGLDVTLDENNFNSYFGKMYLDELYKPDVFQDYFLISLGGFFTLFGILLLAIYFVSLERYNQIIFDIPYDKLYKDLSRKGTIYDLLNNIAITKDYFIYKRVFKYKDITSIKIINYKFYFTVDGKTYKIKYNGDLYDSIVDNNKEVIIEK